MRRSALSREKLLFLVAAGLAFSIMLTFAIVLKIKKNSEKDEAATIVSVQDNVGTVRLLAPERPVRSGTKLSDVRFLEMYWPISQVPAGAIRDYSELKDVYARAELPAGIPLQKKHLTTKQPTSSLEPSPGNRAVTINIDAETAIEFHVVAGTHVDVVLTYHNAQRELTSNVIVQNARVLSLGGDTSTAEDRNEKLFKSSYRQPKSKTVTLDVSPQDALKITTSRQLGKLSLIMRSTGDVKTLPKTEVSQTEIDGTAQNTTAAPVKRNCNRGRLRTPKGEFIIECDGKLTPVQK